MEYGGLLPRSAIAKAHPILADREAQDRVRPNRVTLARQIKADLSLPCATEFNVGPFVEDFLDQPDARDIIFDVEVVCLPARDFPTTR